MTKQIIELGGNIFEATSDYKLKVDCPMYKASHYCMTRDRVSDLPFTLVRFNNGKRWLMITWVAHLNLYLIRKLKFIRYEETDNTLDAHRHPYPLRCHDLMQKRNNRP